MGQGGRHKGAQRLGKRGGGKAADVGFLFQSGGEPAFEIGKQGRVRDVRPEVSVKAAGQKYPLLPLPQRLRPWKLIESVTAEIVAERQGGVGAVGTRQGSVVQHEGVQHAPTPGKEASLVGNLNAVLRTDARGKETFQRRAREGRGPPDAGPAAGGVAAEIGNGKTGFPRKGVIKGQGRGLPAAQEVDGLLMLFAGAQGDAIGPGGGQQLPDGIVRRFFPGGRCRGRAQAGQPRRQSRIREERFRCS